MYTHRLFAKLLAPENEPRNPLIMVDLCDFKSKRNGRVQKNFSKQNLEKMKAMRRRTIRKEGEDCRIFFSSPLFLLAYIKRKYKSR